MTDIDRTTEDRIAAPIHKALAELNAYSRPVSEKYLAALTGEVVRAAVEAMNPRIDTVEQLDALPAKSVVRSDYGEYWEKLSHFWDCLSENGDGGRQHAMSIALPARLLWSPAAVVASPQPATEEKP